MHADNGGGLDGIGPLNLLQVNHGDSRVGVTFCAGLDTGIAPNASAWIDIELPFTHPTSVARLPCARYDGRHNSAYSLDQAIDIFHENVLCLSLNPSLLLPATHDPNGGFNRGPSEFRDILSSKWDVQQYSIFPILAK